MTLGPREVRRCKNKPVAIVAEAKPGPDGQKGAMSMCEDCLAVFRKNPAYNTDFITIYLKK